MRSFADIAGALFVAASLFGCTQSTKGAPPPDTTTTAANDLPPPQALSPTTSGPIALGNLTGQIDALEANLAANAALKTTGNASGSGSAAPKGTPSPTGTLTPKGTASPTGTLAPKGTAPPIGALAPKAATAQGVDRSLLERRRMLIDLLSVRAEMAGRIQDLERSCELAETLPEMSPDADSYLARAAARASLHRFEEAESDLDEAEKRGAPKARSRATRVSILAARGKLEEALSLQREAASTRKDIGPKTVLATLLGELGGELGRREEALSVFRAALDGYQDTSPFPVAYLFFQQGAFWEREGRRDLAAAHYREALSRVPTYAHAAAHLARLTPPEQAISLLEPLLATSDDPEILSVLAEKHQDRGDQEKASSYIAKAAARFTDLVSRHPFAFADHAAQFWLDIGGDAKKALDLAKINLQSRKTAKAYELAVTAALAAKDHDTACLLGAEAEKLPQTSSILRDILKTSCAP